MALPRLESETSTIQPSPATRAVDVEAAQAEAGAQTQASRELQSLGEQGSQYATQILRDETLKQAQRDAAGVVGPDARNPDGTLKPYSDASRGWGGVLYNQTYNQASIEYYRSVALTEAQGKASEITARYPTDPEAVNRELGIYLNEKTAAMPRDLAASMAPHFAATLSGATSSARAGQARANLTVMNKEADSRTESWVIAASNTRASNDYKNLPPEVRDSTDARLADEYKIVEKLQKQAGYTDIDIARNRERNNAIVAAHVKGMEIRDKAAALGYQPVDSTAIRKEIEDWIAADPKRAMYRSVMAPVMESYHSWGAAIANAGVQQQGIAAQDAQGEITRMYQQGLDIVRNPPADPNSAAAQERQYTEHMAKTALRAAELASKFRPAQAAGIIAAAGTPIPQQVALYNAALIGATSKMDFGMTDQDKAQGRADVQLIRSNDFVTRFSGSDPSVAQLKRSADQALFNNTVRAKMGDYAGIIAEISSSKFDDTARMDLVNRAAIAHPYAPPTDFSNAYLAGKKAYDASAAQGRLAGQGMRAFAPIDPSISPRLATAEEFAAVRAQEAEQGIVPYKSLGADGRPAASRFDENNPNHWTTALQRFQKNGGVDKEVLDVLSGYDSTTDPTRRQRAIDFRQGMKDILMAKWRNTMMSPDLQITNRETQVAAALGETNSRKIEAYANVGAGMTNEQLKIQAEMTRISPTKNLNSATKESANDIISGMGNNAMIAANQGTVGQFATDAFKSTMDTIASISNSGQGWLSEKSAIWGNKDTRSVYASLPLTNHPDQLLRMDEVKDGGFRMDDASTRSLRQYLFGPNGFIERMGDFYEKKGIDPIKAGTAMWFQQSAQALSRERSVDPTDPNARRTLETTRWHDFVNDYNQEKGLHGNLAANNESLAAMGSAVWRMENQRSWNDLDPRTISYTTITHPDGTVDHLMQASSKDGARLYSHPIRPDHPGLDQERVRTAEMAAKEMEHLGPISRAVLSLPGTGWLRADIAQNKFEGLLKLRGERDMPTKEYAELMNTIMEGPVGQMMKLNGATDKDIEEFKTERTRQALARYGGIYTYLVGNDAVSGVLTPQGQYRTAAERPAEQVIPAPMTQEMLGDVEKARRDQEPPPDFGRPSPTRRAYDERDMAPRPKR